MHFLDLSLFLIYDVDECFLLLFAFWYDGWMYHEWDMYSAFLATGILKASCALGQLVSYIEGFWGFICLFAAFCVHGRVCIGQCYDFMISL